MMFFGPEIMSLIKGEQSRYSVGAFSIFAADYKPKKEDTEGTPN